MPPAIRLLTLVAIVLLHASVAPAHAQRPDLSGVWVLNAAESDSTEALEEAAGKPMPRPPGARGVILGGGTGLPGMGGGFGLPRGFDPELMRQAITLVENAHERMILDFSADTLLVSVDGAAPWSIVVNGKKSRRAWLDGEMSEIKASWKDDHLRIERKLDSELKIIDTFTLDRKTGRLVAVTEADGPIPRAIEMKRVYDRATDPPPGRS